jgi:anti-anti-sigma regulatory factor
MEGWGTLRESPLLHGLAVECLNNEPSELVVDLSCCEYLDSTFLGCLVDLHKRFAHGPSPRFLVAGGPEQRQRLLAPLQLHRVLNVIDEVPATTGEWLTVCAARDTGDLTPQQLGRHVLECHRRLEELGGANAAIFGPIIERLARDLQAIGPSDDLTSSRQVSPTAC